MAILDRFILPSDVVIAPVEQLPPETRAQIEHDEGDCAVTRPRTRSTSTIVDSKTAALLEAFRAPATIVDAVIAFSAAENLDPRATLEEAFPILGGFVNDGLLVAAESPLAEPIATSLAAAERIATFEVVAPVQVVADTEVYLAAGPDGSWLALKIARARGARGLAAAFAHEADVLGALDGRVNPLLLELGEHDERPFLATSWCAGVDMHQAAADARGLTGAEGRAVLLTLAERVIEAYAHLHAQGVLHGDVHPRNALAGPGGEVTIVDYGLASRPTASGAGAPAWRGGIDFFLEPEAAAARLEGRPATELSSLGEQYSLGALLYLLLTGEHTQAFSLEPQEMLRQLLELPPDPFERHGAADLPAVERVLARALAKEPDARHASVADFLHAFRGAAAKDRAGAPSAARRRDPAAAQQLLDEVLGRLTAPGELFSGELQAPTASGMNGGAGFAYTLLRAAGIRDDETLLAQADVWSARAQSEVKSETAFFNADLDIVPEAFGENSFYHHAAGVHGVQALVAAARGDEWAHRLAVERFLAKAAEPCEHVDVAFGRAGLLLGCTLMLDALAPSTGDGPLRSLGDAIRDDLWEQLDRQPPLSEGPELADLGAAHGWAGYLFALLRWGEASATAPPAGLARRLDELAALARPAGRGLRWPYKAGNPVTADGGLESSWCNGAAGYVHLWTLAHRHLGDERFARLAEMAAWTAYQPQSSAGGDLCCGYAGRAYALLCLYKHTEDAAWLVRTRTLADLAATSIRRYALRRDSLYKGEVGVALLVADLEQPEDACMPLFAAEGWPRR